MEILINGTIVDDEDAEIYRWYGMTVTSSSDVRQALDRAKGEEVEVHINSGGGSVWSGSEIYTRLKDYAGKVTVKIMGLAGSAASVVAMAGDNVMMSPTAQIMIHNSARSAEGDHNALEHAAGMLKSVNIGIANAYELKTGLKHDELLALMEKETWMNADEAKRNNFIDEVMFSNGQTKIAAAVKTNNDGLLPQSVINKARNQMVANGEIENKQHTHNSIKPQDSGQNINNKLKEEEMTLEELRNAYPDLCNQIKAENQPAVTDESKIEEAKNEAITAERNRVEVLNNLKNIPGASNIVEEAIKNGDSVNDTTIKIANSEEIKNIGEAGLENKAFKEDLKNSGSAAVKAETLKNKGEEEEEKTNSMIKNMVNKKNNVLGSR